MDKHLILIIIMFLTGLLTGIVGYAIGYLMGEYNTRKALIRRMERDGS